MSAGDEWKPSEYGLEGIVENLGLLSYEETGQIYRESAVGVVMMLTRHPSYLPLELMASGCVAVTNSNLLDFLAAQGRGKLLLAAATATAIADTVQRALCDSSLRERIRTNALAMVRASYLDWETEAEHVFDFLVRSRTDLSREDDRSPVTAVTGA